MIVGRRRKRKKKKKEKRKKKKKRKNEFIRCKEERFAGIPADCMNFTIPCDALSSGPGGYMCTGGWLVGVLALRVDQ